MITLTAGQSVSLHGWLSPRQTLTWRDVCDNETITFEKCRACNISLKQLHQLQSDVKQWVAHGSVSFRHAYDMHRIWQINPLADMKADLADILSMQWGSETIRSLNITYTDLRRVGMTPETMQLFGFTLAGWTSLGFTPSDLNVITDAQIAALFGMTRQMVQSCFPSYGV